jgi:hypothetical protein
MAIKYKKNQLCNFMYLPRKIHYKNTSASIAAKTFILQHFQSIEAQFPASITKKQFL